MYFSCYTRKVYYIVIEQGYCQCFNVVKTFLLCLKVKY